MSPEAGTSLQEMGIKSSGKGQTPQLEGGLNWQPGGAEDWSCAQDLPSTALAQARLPEPCATKWASGRRVS